MNANDLSAALRGVAVPLLGTPDDHDGLLERIGDASLVLIGEASHGTAEFYRERALLTQRLIEERGFDAVALEADWPDAWRVNRWVTGRATGDAVASLQGFARRFPVWMWRNSEVVRFLHWLRAHNEDTGRRVGVYGLDLYSLHASIQAVLQYLQHADPAGARLARERYSCFEHFAEDPQLYGYSANLGLARKCEDEAVRQLVELLHAAGHLARDGAEEADAWFDATQNARLVVNAEQYYRAMFHGRHSTWNLRDQHMVDALEALLNHLERVGLDRKVVVWAHNSHLGDARRTESGDRGEWNVGQLVREKWGDRCVLIGQTTYSGSVTASSHWDGPTQRKFVKPGLPQSWEAVLHGVGIPRFWLDLREHGDLLPGRRLQRAIGVIYRPDTERQSHYFHAEIARQFDLLLHLDHTSALEPVDLTQGWKQGDRPETWPFGV